MSEPDLEAIRELFGETHGVRGRLPWNGSAFVYEAVSLDSGEVRALAVLPVDCESHPELAVPFREAAGAIAAFVDGRVVRVVASGVTHGVPWMELERPDGETLAELLARRRLSTAETVSIARELLRALSGAHRRGLGHWDLTPSNVLVHEADGELVVRVIGVGLGPMMETLRPPEERGEATTSLPKGSGPHAARYVAPEVRQHAGSDASDLFSVGAVLFHMLRGDPPPREGVAPATAGLDGVISRAMEREPAKRFADADAMREALEELDRVPRSNPPGPMPAAETAAAPAPASTVTAPVAALAKQPTSTLAWIATFTVAIAVAVIAWAWVLLRDAGPVAATSTDGVQGGPTRTSQPPPPVPDPVLAPPVPRPVPDPAPDPAGPADPADPGAPAPDPEALLPPDPPPVLVPPPTTVDDPSLNALVGRIYAGERLTTAELQPLYTYAANHRGDPTPHLALAHAFTTLHWYADAFERYRQAIRASEAALDHPHTIPDLVEITASESVGEQAIRQLVNVYGEDAIPAVDRALAAGPARARADQLRRIRARLGGAE